MNTLGLLLLVIAALGGLALYVWHQEPDRDLDPTDDQPHHRGDDEPQRPIERE